jgi:hypothetical protein
MTTDAMTEPWSRVGTTIAAKAAAPPLTTTAMRRLSMRLLRSGSDPGSRPRDPHATQPAVGLAATHGVPQIRQGDQGDRWAAPGPVARACGTRRRRSA